MSLPGLDKHMFPRDEPTIGKRESSRQDLLRGGRGFPMGPQLLIWPDLPRLSGQGLDCLPSGAPGTQTRGSKHVTNETNPTPAPCALQEAVADVLSALRLDPQTAVPELRSLKPEAQALITQGLSSCCRGLLSRRPGPGAPLSDSDIQGLLAAGEALIEMDVGQPRGHLLLADVLMALGTWQPGLRPWSLSLCPPPLTLGVPSVNRERP